VHILSAWLLVLVLALYAAAIYLARGARRETLRNVGLSLVLVGLIVLIARRALGNYAVDTLASPSYKGSIHDVWLIGTSILGQIGAATVLYGAVAAAGAVLAGPTKYATALRRRFAPVLNERVGMVFLGASFVYLLLLYWGPTHALRVWWGILLLAGLLALGIVAFRRQTLSEFPAVAEEPAQAAPETPETPEATDEISRLVHLHDAGEISDEEFARALNPR
jgi:hypothetical protein